MQKTRSELVSRCGLPAMMLMTIFGGAEAAVGPAMAPDLQGVWITTQTAPMDPRWRIEDFLCGGFCSIAAHEYLRSVLADPQNDTRPLKELSAQIGKYGRDYIAQLLTPTAHSAATNYDMAADPVNKCAPTGFNYAAGPLPIEIKQYPDRVLLRYEFWNSTRTVYLDGRGFPTKLMPTRLGYSIGWYEGQTLVVETAGIEPNLSYWAGGTKTSSHLRAYERYSRSKDGSRLEIEKTMADPVNLIRPLTTSEVRLVAPEVQIMDFRCEAPEPGIG